MRGEASRLDGSVGLFLDFQYRLKARHTHTRRFQASTYYGIRPKKRYLVGLGWPSRRMFSQQDSDLLALLIPTGVIVRTSSSKGSDDGIGVMIDIDLRDPTIRAGFSVYVGYSTV